MTVQLKMKEISKGSHAVSVCNCDHCVELRRQQNESELRWVKLHQLFDR